VLDLAGQEEEVGKSLGTDLEKGKLTLPVIRLLRGLPERRRRELQELISSPDGSAAKRDAVLGAVRENGILPGCLDRAREFLAAARKSLDLLGDAPDAAPLRDLASFALHRRA